MTFLRTLIITINVDVCQNYMSRGYEAPRPHAHSFFYVVVFVTKFIYSRCKLKVIQR